MGKINKYISTVPLSELFEPPKHIAMRSGVIPYTQIGDKIYWLMGQAHWGRWTDFGGGCKVKYNETPASCMFRELDEESSGVLTEIVRWTLKTQPDKVIVWRSIKPGRSTGKSLDGSTVKSNHRYNKDIYKYLTFVPIPHWDHSMYFKPNDEVKDLVWIKEEDILYPPNLRWIHEPILEFIRFFVKEDQIIAQSASTQKTMKRLQHA